MLAQAFSKNFSRIPTLFILATFTLPLVVSAQVNINTADLQTLDTLPGIGPVIAQRIVDYRSLNGPFQNIEELKNVTGIGDVIFANLKDFVTVGDATTGPQPSPLQTSTSTTSQPLSSGSGASSSSSNPSTALIISGGNRVGTVGTPIEFRVERGGSGGQIFKWNFGDGAQGGGSVVTHVYDYPGDYTVVLSVATSQGESSARVNVRIIEPEVVVTIANAERIELSNPSGQEVNLFGRAISAGGKIFMFPKDTFVRPGAKVSFSSMITGLLPNYAGEVEWMVIGENRDVFKIERMIEERKEERIARIKNEIGQLEQRLAVARANNVPRQSTPSVAPIVAEESDSIDSEESLEANEANLASVVVGEEAGNKMKWLDVLKRFFLRTQ